MDTVSNPGFNYRMTELQVAVGIAQLKKLKLILSKNKKRYDLLSKTLGQNLKSEIISKVAQHRWILLCLRFQK